MGHEAFRVLATMNPGGDFGKKELSPALRNRFTEIWVPEVADKQDLLRIISSSLRRELEGYAPHMLAFIDSYRALLGARCVVSLRDIMAWVRFMNGNMAALGTSAALVHGAALVFIDAIGTGVNVAADPELLQRQLLSGLIERLPAEEQPLLSATFLNSEAIPPILESPTSWGLAPFAIDRGPLGGNPVAFDLSARTPALNAYRVLRALQLGKPVLLEGSPGVGKTSLVMAIAKAAGHRVVRLNLSEQTDIMDLFGSDLPVEGSVGQFAWRDGPLLEALRNGDWVLLDELNLASQSVLEGLNACLDHRGEVFIPELNRSFKCAAGRFRLFACQNPLHQGGGRKGLPKSFLNRFSQVRRARHGCGAFLAPRGGGDRPLCMPGSLVLPWRALD